MKIGIPKEVKEQEFRVGITPAGVAALRSQGHDLFVATHAGEGSGYPDRAYRQAGARVVASKAALFAQSEIIVKVKEPLDTEYELFRPGQILLTYLHLAAEEPLFRFLMKRQVTAIAYETIEISDGTKPILRPMSEVAGKMAVLIGAHYLQRAQGGCGILLSGMAGVFKPRVTIIGGGVVGKSAAQNAVGLGAAVTVIDENSSRRSYLHDFFHGEVVILPPHGEDFARSIETSHLVIGAVARVGEKAPRLVTRKMVSRMPKGAVVVDVAIDQGGCFETSRVTSHLDPIYLVHGVIHYCVPNIPGVVPQTATVALCNETFPYLSALATWGLKEAIQRDVALARGVNLYQGKVVHPGVAAAFGMPCQPMNP